MPNVEDLTISLTVKETGKLGQLKKKLDSIMGAGGAGIEFQPQLPGFQSMKDDVKYIKSKLLKELSRIFPQFWGGEATRVQETMERAGTLMKQLDTFGERIMDSIKERGGFEKAAKALGLKIGDTTEEEISRRLEHFIESMRAGAQEILKGNWTDDRSRLWLKIMEDIVKDTGSDINQILGQFRKSMEHMPEDFLQKAIKLLADSVGTYVERELNMMPFKSWTKLIENFDPESVNEFLKRLEEFKNEEIKNLIEPFKDMGKASTKLFEVLKDKFGFSGKELSTILKSQQKLEEEMGKNEKLKKFIKGFVAKGLIEAKKGGKLFRFPESIRKWMNEMLKNNEDIEKYYSLFDNLGSISIDDMVMNVNKELAEIFPQLKKFIDKSIPIEAKTFFEPKHIPELEKREKTWEDVAVITGRYTDKVGESVEASEKLRNTVTFITAPGSLLYDLKKRELSERAFELTKIDKKLKSLRDTIEDIQKGQFMKAALKVAGKDPTETMLEAIITMLREMGKADEEIKNAIEGLDLPEEQEEKMRSMF